jgi:LPPG:FO 2-phospho-L-lactate transferase
MSDDQVQTKVVTEKGLLTFNEYYVRERCSPRIMGTIYEGAKIAKPGPKILKVINDADMVVIGPSNPIAGIGPILSLEPIRNALKLCRKKVVVVSPIIGDKPVSGPAEKMMQAGGVEVSVLGIARLYSDVASKIYIHHSDRNYIKKVEKLQMSVIATNILMKNLLDSSKLAEEILMSPVPRS